MSGIFLHTCKVPRNKHLILNIMFISVPKMTNIIVATDLPGRHLPSYTNRFHPFHHTARCLPIIIPWATIEHIYHAIISNFQQNQQSRLIPHYISITVSAGICNLTTKITIRGGGQRNIIQPLTRKH